MAGFHHERRNYRLRSVKITETIDFYPTPFLALADGRQLSKRCVRELLATVAQRGVVSHLQSKSFSYSPISTDSLATTTGIFGTASYILIKRCTSSNPRSRMASIQGSATD